MNIGLKSPRSSALRHLLKLVVVLVGSFGPAVLEAILFVFVGFGGPVVVITAIVLIQIPLIVLFLVTEDRDFDWNRYTDRDNDADALVVLAVGAIGTVLGFLFGDVIVGDRRYFWAAGLGILAAYEVFVYRNRGFFPADTWPWVGSVYFRVRL